MKSSTGKVLTIAVLLFALAMCGSWRSFSNTDKKSPTQASQSLIPKGKLAKSSVEAQTYRSPGAAHKILISNQQPAGSPTLLSARDIKKARKYGTYSLLEVTEETLSALGEQASENFQLRDDFNLILLRSGQLDTTAPEPQVHQSLRQETSPARSLHLVQLFGPPTSEALDGLKSTGVKIVSYIPNNAYIIWASRSQLAGVRALRRQTELIQWDAPFHPAYKIDPRIKLDSVAQVAVSIEFLDTPEAAQTLAQIQAVARKVLMPDFQVAGTRQIKILTESLKLAELAKLPEVLAIEPWAKPQMHDERANQIVAGSLVNETVNNVFVTRPANPGYFNFLNSLGFNSNFDFIVDVADSGFDKGSAASADVHSDFLDTNGQSRIAYLHDFTHSSAANPTRDAFGHGTFNASLIGGYNSATSGPAVDALGYQYGIGVAPRVRLGISRIFNDRNEIPEDLSFAQLLNAAYNGGARISNNSWGLCALELGFCNLYSSDSRTYDALVRDIDPNGPGYQQMVVIFSAGNAGGDLPQSVSIPGTAKNVITVGASEGFRPTDANGTPLRDGCNIGSTLADNVQDVVDFSSGGPLQDGRIKPDLVAPGTHLTGAASQDPAYAAKPIDEIGICDRFFPAAQTLYTLSSGTSHSAPLVTGGAALAFQWLKNRFGTEPGAALVKAMLLNSTSYLTGKLANDNLPGGRQGWGLLNIQRMFENSERIIYDESPSRTFTQSGGAPFEITGVISDPAKEFRAMLVWSDAPGTALSNAPYVNQLNIEVTVGGVTYKGNVFQGQYSKAGGQADFLNNTQGVRLPAETTGPFVIRVKPTIIAGDGVPFNGVDLDQDFALVVSNGRETPAPILDLATTKVANVDVPDISIQHANGSTDRFLLPGESASITVGIRNASQTTAANISSATLRLVGAAATGESNFATIAAGEAVRNSTPFTLQVPNTLRCGSTADLQLTLATAIGDVIVPLRIQVGRTTSQLTLLDDDVDSGRVRWKAKKGFTTATNVGLSGTQSYYVTDPGRLVDDFQLSWLMLKKPLNIPVNAANIRFSFFHIHHFEPGFDGGVMEFSLDDGITWEDLGSRILVGGYDGKVSDVDTSDNPLGTRFAWTSRGRAGIFTPVVINFDEFAGKTIRLRFVAGFDAATGILDGYKGWYIDNLKLTADSVTCP
jgi:hypothetical protein